MEKYWLQLFPDFPNEKIVGFKAELMALEDDPILAQYKVTVEGYIPEKDSLGAIRQAAILRMWAILETLAPPPEVESFFPGKL